MLPTSAYDCNCPECYIAALEDRLNATAWQAEQYGIENTRLAQQITILSTLYQTTQDRLASRGAPLPPPPRPVTHEMGCQIEEHPSAARDTQTDPLPPDPVIESLRKDLLRRGEINSELNQRIGQAEKKQTKAETALAKTRERVALLQKTLADAQAKIPKPVRHAETSIQTTQTNYPQKDTQTTPEIPPQAQSVAYLMLAGLLSSFAIPPALLLSEPDRLLRECKGDLYQFHNLLFQRTWEHLIVKSLSATEPLPREQLACIVKLAKVIEPQFYTNGKKPDNSPQFFVESPALTAALLQRHPASAPATVIKEWGPLLAREHP